MMTGNTCTIEDCTRKVLARTWCNRHYRRWYLYDDPHTSKRGEYGLPLLTRLLSKIEVGDCWEWTGTKIGEYGRIEHKKIRIMAHRAIWEELVGPIPEGFQLDHLCRNRGCVNPDHLEPVTPRENVHRDIGIQEAR